VNDNYFGAVLEGFRRLISAGAAQVKQPQPKRQLVMATGPTISIQKETQRFTFINVFTVAPERQDELLNLLIDVTDNIMRHIPGFVAASFHRGLDGRSVVNYAQWLTQAHFNAMLKNPKANQHFEEVRAIAEKVQPIPCSITYVGVQEDNCRSIHGAAQEDEEIINAIRLLMEAG
jgi:hypothetical protein